MMIECERAFHWCYSQFVSFFFSSLFYVYYVFYAASQTSIRNEGKEMETEENKLKNFLVDSWQHTYCTTTYPAADVFSWILFSHLSSFSVHFLCSEHFHSLRCYHVSQRTPTKWIRAYNSEPGIFTFSFGVLIFFLFFSLLFYNRCYWCCSSSCRKIFFSLSLSLHVGFVLIKAFRFADFCFNVLHVFTSFILNALKVCFVYPMYEIFCCF